MATLTQIPSIPQSLWTSTVPSSIQPIIDSPTFSVAPKTYGTGQNLVDESNTNKTKINAFFGENYWVTHYAAGVENWITNPSILNKTSPNGVQTLNTSELNLLADIIANSTQKYVITDYEPGNPTKAWVWDYADPNFLNNIQYLANRIKTVHNKIYYDWISARTDFVLNGENYSLDGANNDGFANKTFPTNNVDKALEPHRNPQNVVNLVSGVINQIGIGYTSLFYNAGLNNSGTLPNTKFLGVQNMVLKCLDNIALKHKLEPTKSLIGYFWPLEDKPVNTFRRNIYTKFKPNSTTGSYPQSLTGKVTISDNRTTYPSNIFEDVLLWTLCYPNLIHNEYWIHGGSYNPYAQIRYSSINSGTTSCIGGSSTTGNYQGSEGSLPCPSNLENYLGVENRTVGALVKAHRRYGVYLKDILDGTQIPEFYQFQYKRTGQTSFTNSQFENHTGQAALGWKYEQPVLIVWKNSSNQRVILFWDLFADAFSQTEFKVTISGTEYTGTTKGNRLYPSILEQTGGSGGGDTGSSTNNCIQGPTLLSINSSSSTSLTFLFDGINVTTINYRIKQGSTIVRNGSVNPTNNTPTITYATLTEGNYTLEIEGGNCTSNVSIGNFSISSSNDSSKELVFVVNATGNAIDFNSPGTNYISPDKIQLITDALTGSNADVVDAIRLPFIWGNYNPSNGVFYNSRLTTAINWVKSLRPSKPVKIDLLIVPILNKQGETHDTRIPSNERLVDNNGNDQDCTYAFNTVPSYNSPAMTNVLSTGFDSLIPYLNTNHANDIRVIEFGAGQSEEHYMPYTSNNGIANGCQGIYSGIGDYSEASRNAWRVWLAAKYGSGNLPYLINGVQYTASNAVLPNVGVTSTNNNNMDYSLPSYRDLFRFYSKSIFNIWKRFYDKVKQHSSFKTGYFIPDFLNEQGTKWIFHGGTIFEGMKYADQFYHTYNEGTDGWYANLWGTDVLLGTFPNQNKLSAIEYDTLDAGSGGLTNPINSTHVKNSILIFVKNGGKVVHTALGWSTAQMNQWKALIADVKTNFISNNSWNLQDRTTAQTVSVNTADIFTNPYIYRNAWNSVGGNNQFNTNAYNAAPVNIVIQNNGLIDNFYT